MRLHEFTTKQELDEIGVGLAARYLAKRIAQAANTARRGPPKPEEAITKKAPETISQNKQAAQQRIDQHQANKVSERKLSKKEVKTRDKYADDLPDKEFKKRYGKDWESVKYATATKMAKKKNESIGDKDVANYVSEKDTKIS